MLYQELSSSPKNESQSKKSQQSIQFKDNRSSNISTANIDNSPKSVAQLQKVSHIDSSPIQRQENKTGLPDHLKSGIENLSGYSMDDVRVHYNSSQPAQLQAHAYAQGNQIHVASGQEQHLPHEAWHVVQQKQGRVHPTKQLKRKININDDAGLEREADIMGSKALQQSFTSSTTLQKKTLNTRGVAQREVNITKPTEKSFMQLKEFTLSEMVQYTEQQADWNIGLNKSEFDLIFNLMNFVEQTDCLGLYGKFTIKSFYLHKGKLFDNIPDLLHKLALLQKETNPSTTDFLKPIEDSSCFEALNGRFIKIVDALAEFNDIIPLRVKKTFWGDAYADMAITNKLSFLYKYLNAPCKPVFENEDDSINFRLHAEKYVYFAYTSKLSQFKLIRNFHRFDPRVLKQLEINITSGQNSEKPLTLIIYTSYDHSGSFVHKTSIASVVCNKSNLTLLIEGKGNLKEYITKAKQLAHNFGINKQISQVLICGHGSTQVVKLNKSLGKSISLEENKENTINFFKELVSLMYTSNPYSGFGGKALRGVNSNYKAPDEIQQLSKIVFSACEVNSIDLPNDKSLKENVPDYDPQYIPTNKELKVFYKNKRTIVQTLQDMLGDQKTSFPKIIGSNANIISREQTLIDDNGNVGFFSKPDPYITASKSEYIEHGTMAEGVLKIVFHQLIHNPWKTKQLIKKRLKTQKFAKTVNGILLESAFIFIKENKFNIEDVWNNIQPVKDVYDAFRSIKNNKKFPFKLSDIKRIFSNPKISTYFTYLMPFFKRINYNNFPTQLVLFQIKIILEKNTEFFLYLLEQGNCKTIAPFLSWDILSQDVLSKIFSSLTPGTITLAICGAAKNNIICLKFLSTLLDKESNQKFDKKFVKDINKSISGFSTISSIGGLLHKIIKKQRQIASIAKNANVTPMEGLQNLAYVEPVHYKGKFVDGRSIPILQMPEKDYSNLDIIKVPKQDQYIPHKNEEVYIMGETKHFWAIILYPEYKHLVFVNKADIIRLLYIPEKINIKHLRDGSATENNGISVNRINGQISNNNKNDNNTVSIV